MAASSSNPIDLWYAESHRLKDEIGAKRMRLKHLSQERCVSVLLEAVAGLCVSVRLSTSGNGELPSH